MLRLTRIVSGLSFFALMTWGAWATLYGRQLRGEDADSLSDMPSSAFSAPVLWGVLGLVASLPLLTLFGTVLKMVWPSSMPARRKPSAELEDSDRLAHLDDDYIAAYAARYHSNTTAAAQSSSNSNSPSQPMPSHQQSQSFGRRA